MLNVDVEYIYEAQALIWQKLIDNENGLPHCMYRKEKEILFISKK